MATTDLAMIDFDDDWCLEMNQWEKCDELARRTWELTPRGWRDTARDALRLLERQKIVSRNVDMPLRRATPVGDFGPAGFPSLSSPQTQLSRRQNTSIHGLQPQPPQREQTFPFTKRTSRGRRRHIIEETEAFPTPPPEVLRPAEAEQPRHPAQTSSQSPQPHFSQTSAVASGPALENVPFDVSRLFVPDKILAKAAALELARLGEEEGPSVFQALDLTSTIVGALLDHSPCVREGACRTIFLLCHGGAGSALEPFLIDTPAYPCILNAFADRDSGVCEAALDAALKLTSVQSPWAAAIVLPMLLHQIETASKWQVKDGALQIFNKLIGTAPQQMARLFPQIIPVLTAAVWDTSKNVRKRAKASLKTATALVSNKDIGGFIPSLISALINPEEDVLKCIDRLAATTFVSDVDAPTLALMVPVLSRGILHERKTETKRKVAVIVDNMAKLVDNEFTVRPFIPELLPGLLKFVNSVGDPETRSMIERAITTLREVGKLAEDNDGCEVVPITIVEPESIAALMVSLYDKVGVANVSPASDHTIIYIARLAAQVAAHRSLNVVTWETAMAPYLSLVLPEQVRTEFVPAVLSTLTSMFAASNVVPEKEEEDVCNCEISLAYGIKTLLTKTRLHLKRGHRYGLCGRNGSGKSTLMTSIMKGQVEGFPSLDEVRTFYVEHDIDGSEAETAVLDWIMSDKRIQANPQEIIDTLSEVGFSDERQKVTISSLSGGWKMKLALARAVLFKADILLLDEPTNHLDVDNVAWLEKYLTGLKTCTSIIVSHESSFLNNVITDVLHLHKLKLHGYKGNLQQFVAKVPEAKSYYSLDVVEDFKFKLPDPPRLEGVKSNTRAVLKMSNVGFQYDSQPVQQLIDITLQVSLSSRVAIIGPNGSGKSTLVKLLIGSFKPNRGGWISKHINLVIGYVAQHAFHHIDHHLDKTPVEYMLWRYQKSEDMEEMTKITRFITAEEEAFMKKEGVYYPEEGPARVIDKVLERKKLKQSYQYEVSFKDQSTLAKLPSSENIWLPRNDLIKRGFEKKVEEVDSREAQRFGLERQLIRREIEKHFADCGLGAEFVSHTKLGGLSGGQKVKVVLAAATWRRPHVLCLDEPTNYLDRDSLAALIEALKAFQGGVLIITHNNDFSKLLCTEEWKMRDGRLEPHGHDWAGKQTPRYRGGQPAAEEPKRDYLGNLIDAPIPQTDWSAKDDRLERKVERRMRMAQEKIDRHLLMAAREEAEEDR